MLQITAGESQVRRLLTLTRVPGLVLLLIINAGATTRLQQNFFKLTHAGLRRCKYGLLFLSLLLVFLCFPHRAVYCYRNNFVPMSPFASGRVVLDGKPYPYSEEQSQVLFDAPDPDTPLKCMSWFSKLNSVCGVGANFVTGKVILS